MRLLYGIRLRLLRRSVRRKLEFTERWFQGCGYGTTQDPDSPWFAHETMHPGFAGVMREYQQLNRIINRIDKRLWRRPWYA